MYVSPQGLLVAGNDPQLNPDDKGLIAAVVPHPAGVQIVAKGKHQRWGFATGAVDIKTSPGVGMQMPGIGSNYLSNDTVRLYSTANATDTVWERPVKQVSVLVVFVKYGNASGGTPLFGNGSPNTAPYEAWSLDDISGALQFGYSAGGTFRFVNGGAGSIVIGRLNVALATYDGATARLFLNGVLLNAASQTGDLTYPSAVDRGPGFCSFFDYPFNNRALNGRIFLGGLWETGLSLSRGVEITKSPQAAFEAVLGSRGVWLPMPASAGGSTYPVSLTESATTSDAATAAYIAAASVSESITAADSLAAATTWARSLTEAATAAESVTTAGTFAASITEPASVADALTSAVTWARALTEAASASDLATAIRHAVAALTEAATAGDSQTTGSIYTGSLTEAASVSDALTAAATLVALLTEVATASDAATSAATWVRLLTEPATAVDSVAGAQGATYTASVTEVLAAAELLVAVLGSTEALGRYTIAAKARRLTITAKPRRLEIRK